MRLPQLFTSRYFAEDVLSPGDVVPTRVSYEAPIIPLGYPLEEIPETLVPEFAMLGEWNHLCQTYRHKLDTLGVERIGEELAGVPSTQVAAEALDLLGTALGNLSQHGLRAFLPEVLAGLEEAELGARPQRRSAGGVRR